MILCCTAARQMLMSFTNTIVAPERNQKEQLQALVKKLFDGGGIQRTEDELYTVSSCGQFF